MSLAAPLGDKCSPLNGATLCVVGSAASYRIVKQSSPRLSIRLSIGPTILSPPPTEPRIIRTKPSLLIVVYDLVMAIVGHRVFSDAS